MDNINRQLSLYVDAVKEAYPELKANTNFKNLMDQLESSNNRINTELNQFTSAVNEYNNKVRRFPGNIYAGIFGFKPKEQFVAAPEAQTNPAVKF